MRQWQCPCGAWLDMSVARHIHKVDARSPTLSEMIAARNAGHDETALNQVHDIAAILWQPHYPRRDKPDDCA